MSRELIFYPGFKDATTQKYSPLLFDDKGSPASIFWRSGSFIDLDYFTEELPMLRKEDFASECRDYFANGYDDLYKSFNKEGDIDDAPTYVYLLTEDCIYKNAQSSGLVSGYALLEDMRMFYQSDCPQEYFTWEMDKPIPAELYAELPLDEQKKYGRFVTIDRYSKEYVCSVLAEVLDDIIVDYGRNGEKCVLVMFSF